MIGHSAAQRRFKTVEVVPEGGMFAVFLDDLRLKTPAGKAVFAPSKALALALADEWKEQGQTILPATMPLTQLVFTAADRVAGRRAEVVDDLLHYAGSDLLCYRADAPAELAARQAAAWDPWLEWSAKALGARLSVTVGIIAVNQPKESLDALKAEVESFSDMRLAALASAAAALGSLVLGLALARGELDAATAFKICQVDETFQIERWGGDEEANLRRERLRTDVVAAATFFDLEGAMANLPETKCVKVCIRGRVQGVFFRAWTCENARKRGLLGWVRNRADGSVDALFSGPAARVDGMLRACWNGPPAAQVTAVDAEPSNEKAGDFQQLPTC